MSDSKQLLKNWGLVGDEKVHSLRTDKVVLEFHEPSGNSYFLKGEEQNQQEVDKILTFADRLIDVLPTPRYIKTLAGELSVKRGKEIFTLEEKLTGDEIESISDKHIKAIATELATMHRFSLDNKLSIGRATTWSLFGGNLTDDIGNYDENEISFQEVLTTCESHSLMPSITHQYLLLRGHIKSTWHVLPKAATQGDFCYYNMLFQEGDLTGIFDFNLAGDEVLINECIAVAVYHSWHAPYSGALSEEERYELYCTAYQEVRKWNSLENEIVDSLKRIIRAFRHDRVAEGLKGNNKTPFLLEILKILK